MSLLFGDTIMTTYLYSQFDRIHLVQMITQLPACPCWALEHHSNPHGCWKFPSAHGPLLGMSTDIDMRQSHNYMNHAVVSHLVQQWSDWIIMTIKNEKHRWNISSSKIKQWCLLTYHSLLTNITVSITLCIREKHFSYLNIFCKFSRHFWWLLISDDRLLFQWEKNRCSSINNSF
jgi:hypothetical protein